ncbi:site-specific integrase [Nocardia terpenica]
MSPQLMLEFQYALQRRHDEQTRTATPKYVSEAVRRARSAGVSSLLDLSAQEWWRKFRCRVKSGGMFLLDAREAVESLRDGTGWEVEYPRDIWRLHLLPGVDIGPGRPTQRVHLRFDWISQPWLRDLGKRWLRMRLSSGLSASTTKAGADALTWFSRFLTQVGVDTLAQVDRPLLERHLAWVNSGPGGLGVKKVRIGQLNTFLQAIRRHGWDDTLPGTAAFFPGDTPPIPEKINRRLAEYVMAQIESADTLARWPDPAGRLVTLILIHCGLRISSALALEFDCLLHDGQGAPYLRYFNTKMKREAAVPIDEDLEADIAAQQQRVLQRWPDGSPHLFPRSKSNATGRIQLSPGSFRASLDRWLNACEIHDEHGRPVKLTPHQWRHIVPA